MQPIFDEQIKMWKDCGCEVPIKGGYYWLNKGLVKAFSPDGNLHTLYKYKVNDDLTISISKHKDNKGINFHVESWEETHQRLKSELQVKIDESLDVIRQAVRDYSDYDFWCATSTGKDSTVILDLVQKVVPDIKVMFNNTSCDVADTYRIVKSHSDWVVNNPKEGFYQWQKRLDFIPRQYSRACCSIFKERNGDLFLRSQSTKVLQFMGIRNSESNSRADREYFEKNEKTQTTNFTSIQCLPIRKWSELDVWLYMLHNNLEIHPDYKRGYKRVGCMVVCPFATKISWVLDKYWHTNAYDRWMKILKEHFIKNSEWCVFNCTIDEYFTKWNGSHAISAIREEVIREMMQYKGITDYEVAKQYFNKTCIDCGKAIKSGDVIAMNMKLYGRNLTEFKCKKCLMKEFNMSKNDWNDKVADFKAQGCKLF